MFRQLFATMDRAVDDSKAYEKYNSEDKEDWAKEVKKNPSHSKAETSTFGVTTEEKEQKLAKDDDELDELIASIAKTTMAEVTM